MLSLIAKGRCNVTPLISHRVLGHEAPKAYQLLMEWNPELLGVVLQWNNGKLIAHCQDLEKEWRKSGKYKFAKSESAKKNTNPADTTKVQAAD